MINNIIYWYYRTYKHEVHPDEMYSILNKIMITKKLDSFHRPYNWGRRKYQMAKQYAVYHQPIESIAKEHDVTRTRVSNIIWRIYWDYKNGIYNEP